MASWIGSSVPEQEKCKLYIAIVGLIALRYASGSLSCSAKAEHSFDWLRHDDGGSALA